MNLDREKVLARNRNYKILRTIRAYKGLNLNLEQIPRNDLKVLKFIRQGQTSGIFLLGNSRIRKHLKLVQSDRYEELVVAFALDSPLPEKKKLLRAYIKRKANRWFWINSFPEANMALKETYGLLIFMDQITKLLTEVGHVTHSMARRTARALGSKSAEELAFLMRYFEERTGKKVLVQKTFDFLYSNLGYTSNRVYFNDLAEIAWQSAYLKFRSYPIDIR